MITLQINGKARAVAAADDTPLLWVLRDELGLTGAKFGCGQTLCGACTVYVDGKPARACTTPIAKLRGRSVTTIEALGEDRVGRAVQQAWVELDVSQCGYCQAGQIMSAAALLKATPAPTDSQIDTAMNRNLCRCGTYPRIRAAIKLAAERLAAKRGEARAAS
jgi:isoquinoline 1-oxidoreductase alpha subunit